MLQHSLGSSLPFLGSNSNILSFNIWYSNLSWEEGSTGSIHISLNIEISPGNLK